MALFSASIFWFGFSQGFVIGPISMYGIREGLNPKRGFWSQIQVSLGATLVDIAYLLASTYGLVNFIKYDVVQLLLWSIASYMLITMGVNSLKEQTTRKMSFTHFHGKKLQFFESDFVRAFLMNVVNPLAITYAVVIFGGMYAGYSNQLTPAVFAANIILSGLAASIIVALATLAVRQVFHEWMLKKLLKGGSLILIGYGIWFLWKAVEHVPELTVSVIHLLNL